MFKEEVYEFVKEGNRHIIIGFGSYGEVKLARKSGSQEYVAIKMVLIPSFRSTARTRSTRSRCTSSCRTRAWSSC